MVKGISEYGEKRERRRLAHGSIVDATSILMMAWVRTHGTGRPAATFGKIGRGGPWLKDTVPGRRDRRETGSRRRGRVTSSSG